MFQLLSVIPRLDLFRRQLPCFTMVFFMASLFYRFGSFALECLQFLATRFVLDVIYGGLARLAHIHAGASGSNPLTRRSGDVH